MTFAIPFLTLSFNPGSPFRLVPVEEKEGKALLRFLSLIDLAFLASYPEIST